MKKQLLAAGLTALMGFSAAQAQTLKDYIDLELPSALEANPGNTYPGAGMSMVAWRITDNTIAVNEKCASPIVLSFGESILAEISCSATEAVTVSGGIASGAEGDDVGGDISAPGSIYINFAYTAAGQEAVPMEYFKMDSEYTVTVPDGAFTVGADATPLKGMTITYTYSSKQQTVLPDPVWSPAEGNIEANDLNNGITLSFPGATFINYAGNCALNVKSSNGKSAKLTYPQTTYSDYVTWNSSNPSFQKELNKLAIADGDVLTCSTVKGAICLNNQYWDESEGNTGNVDALTVVYKIGQATAVTLVGAEAADSYTVVTLGGAVLLRGADAEALLGLEPGIYVINGRKTAVRR